MNIKVTLRRHRLTSLVLSILMLSLSLLATACQPEKSPGAQETNAGEAVSSSDFAATTTEDPENPRITLDPREWESGPQCYASHDRLYFPAEKREPVQADTLTDAQYAEGYRLDLDLGISYFEPSIWRELASVISRDQVGNPNFSDEPIVAGSYYYYLTPSVALALDDLNTLDLPAEQKDAQRQELKKKRIPLFGLLLFRNDKLPTDLQELDAPRGFVQRKILHQDDRHTLILAVAPFQEGIGGEAFGTDYKMIYEGRETIVGSIHAFPAESAEEQLKTRAQLDFDLETFQGEAVTARALYPEKRNFLLIWNDQILAQRDYYERLAQLAAGEQISLQALWAGTQTDFEAAKTRLLGYMAGVSQPLKNYVATEAANSKLFQYLKYTPALIELDGSGQIVQVLYGVRSSDEIREVMLK